VITKPEQLEGLCPPGTVETLNYYYYYYYYYYWVNVNSLIAVLTQQFLSRIFSVNTGQAVNHDYVSVRKIIVLRSYGADPMLETG